MAEASRSRSLRQFGEKGREVVFPTTGLRSAGKEDDIMKAISTLLVGLAIILIGLGLALLAVVSAVEQDSNSADAFSGWVMPLLIIGGLIVICAYMFSVFSGKTSSSHPQPTVLDQTKVADQ
jgi:hypothetical protein